MTTPTPTKESPDKSTPTTRPSSTPGSQEYGSGHDGRLPGLDDNWNQVLDSERGVIGTAYLKIRVPQREIDARATRALEVLGSRAERVRPRVEEYVNAEGLASEISDVTKRLNATNLSWGTRRVLSVVYPLLLDELLDVSGQGDSAQSDPEDTLGFAADVLMKLRAKQGPLEELARMLVDEELEQNGPDLSSQERERLVIRLRRRVEQG